MLFGQQNKYLSMVIGISFAALIMTQQPAIFVGLMSRTYSFISETNLPDIWVMSSGVQFVEEFKPMRDTELARIRGIQGIEWAVPLYKGYLTAKLPDGRTKSIDITGLDDSTLIGAPQLIDGKLELLWRADAILVDKEAAYTQLRVTNNDNSTRPLRVGDLLEINDKRAIVAGYIKVRRNFVLQPRIYTTYSRAISYAPALRKQLTYILVKAKPQIDQQLLIKEIENKTKLVAKTKDQFSKLTYDHWMKSTGIPVNFGISVLLGFAVGAAVAGQTFYNFIFENIKQYASLKAMGLSNKILAYMVMIQAVTVGFVGYGIGVGLTTIFAIWAQDSVLAFKLTPLVLSFAGLGVLIIIIFAAWFAINKVIKIDPALVFRS